MNILLYWVCMFTLNEYCAAIFFISGLTLSILGKNVSKRHFEIFSYFFPENRHCHFMHIVLGDNLMNLNAYFLGKVIKISAICRLLNLPGVIMVNRQNQLLQVF